MDGLKRQIESFQDVLRGGWKVGLTSGTSRDRMGKGFRPFGHIAAERIFESGVELALSDVGDIGVENELCFKFGDDVPVDIQLRNLPDYVESIAPGFELNQQRLGATASDSDRLADNLSQWGIVCGDAIKDWQDIDLDKLSVSLFRDDMLISTTEARGHIDNHLDSLFALVGMLARFGLKIASGDSVITGAFGRSRVERPSVWRGDFGSGIGSVEVRWV